MAKTMDHSVSVTPMDWVTVKTTLPTLPMRPGPERPAIKTERLLLRYFTDADLDGLHALRTQPEVMTWTSQGVPDADLAASQKHLGKRLPPHDAQRFEFAICEADTGAFIGCGGCHLRVGELGWPALGYMFRKEAWGRGYATEFVTAFLEAYWALPRSETEVRVDRSTIEGGEGAGDVQRERLIGLTVQDNKGSQGVMLKSGMPLVKIFEEEDLHKPGSGELVPLYCFMASPPR